MALNPKIDTEVVDPKDVDKLTKAVIGGDEGPTARDLTPAADAWANVRDNPGPPFDATRITIAQMRQMRKDPMIAFALHFRKVPLARANFIINARDKNGPNAQVAAFLDACLRKIFTSYILQRLLCLDFGYQAIVKQWQMANPGGVYGDQAQLDDNGNPTIKPVWDEGNVLPKIWKPFIPLMPENSAPRFVSGGPKDGDFDGIDYTLPQTGTTSTASSRKKGSQGVLPISVYNSLWTTNQKWDELGSLYGFPLTGFARDYWWDYQFIAGLERRAFERIALPPIVAHYPKGSTPVDTDGNREPNWQIALDMAERLRSNAIAAVPSDMAEVGLDQTSSTQRAWDFTYMEVPVDNLAAFDTARNYFNVMKLRATWTPEMAFIGRESGNSGGNIAEQMQDVFFASQDLLMAECVDEIDNYLFPQLLILNFPEFVNNGGKANLIFHSFAEDDQDLLKQVLQLLGQSTPEILAEVDTRELLSRAGLPLKDPSVLAAERQSLAQQAAAAPPIVPPTPGTVGTIANPNVNPGFTNGGSAPSVTAGFSEHPVIYVNPPEQVNLDFAENLDDFLTSLPISKHYEDKTIRALMVQLRKLWQGHFRRLYPEFAQYLAKAEINLDDEISYGSQGVIELADRRKPVIVSKTRAEKLSKKLVDDFAIASTTLNELREKSSVILRKIIVRAAKIDTRDYKLPSEIDDSAIEAYLLDQTSRLIKSTHNTFKDHVRRHLFNEIHDGKATRDIADGLVARFENLPSSSSDRIARAETRDAVNAGTLIASEGAGIRYVRGIDKDTSPECQARNGKLFTVREAWKEMRKEQPYGSFGLEPVPRVNLSIEQVLNAEWPEEMADHLAYFDDNTSTVYFRGEEITDEQLQNYLSSLTDRLIANGNGRH